MSNMARFIAIVIAVLLAINLIVVDAAYRVERSPTLGADLAVGAAIGARIAASRPGYGRLVGPRYAPGYARPGLGAPGYGYSGPSISVSKSKSISIGGGGTAQSSASSRAGGYGYGK